ncbi:hypothetical protein [Microbacterium lacticum]
MEAVLAEARGDLQLVVSDLLVAVAAVLHRLRPELGQALLGSGLALRRLVLRAGRRWVDPWAGLSSLSSADICGL